MRKYMPGAARRKPSARASSDHEVCNAISTSFHLCPSLARHCEVINRIEFYLHIINLLASMSVAVYDRVPLHRIDRSIQETWTLKYTRDLLKWKYELEGRPRKLSDAPEPLTDYLDVRKSGSKHNALWLR